MSFWTSVLSISVGISLLLLLVLWIQVINSKTRSRRSHPIGADPGAGCEPLRDRGHRPQGPIQNAVEAVQGEPVDDLLASAFGLHKSAVTKTREMGGDSRLRLRHLSHQLAHGAFAILKELEDPEPGRIAQDPEEPSRRGSIGRS